MTTRSQHTNSQSKHDSVPDALNQYPFIYEQPIAWGEMDAFSHVNNVVYYRYSESARIGYLMQLGCFDNNVVTVLAQSSCQYLRPVTFPDTLLIGVRCQRLGQTSMTIGYEFYSSAQQAVVAKADSVIVRLDSSASKKLPWTDTERQRLLDFEATVGHTPE